MSGLVTRSVISQTTTKEVDQFEEFLRTTAVTCSISIAVAYFCIAGIICGIGMSGVKTHIHWNVCLALIISNVLLLIGSEREPETIECKITSIATQFFNLASQTWTTVEVIHLFRLSTLDRPPHQNTSSDISRRRSDEVAIDHGDDVAANVSSAPGRVLFYYVIGWLLPGVFVAATVVPALDSYGKSYKCWIVTDNEMTWLFVAPTVALFIFHCAATSAAISNSKRSNTVDLNDLKAGQQPQDADQAARESVTRDEGSEQGTIFVHPPIYVVSEKRLTVRMPADEETNKNISLITHWNFSVLPLISATWCLWISSLSLREIALLYITCAVSAGQVVYVFTYYCVITFRFERTKRVLRKRRTNEDARPVTVVFGDGEEDVKPANKQKKIQNIELMLRTPTPFPNHEPRYILPPAEVNDKIVGRAPTPANFHADAECVPIHSDSQYRESEHKSGNRMFGNRVKLEAFVKVGARLVIGENSCSPSSGNYTFQYNRPSSRSQGILARHSAISRGYDLSGDRIDTEQLSQSIACATVDEYCGPDVQELNARLPFASS